MSIVGEVKTLLGGDGSQFKFVSGALGFAAARENPPNAYPCAFVFLGKEASAANNRATGQIMQMQERDLHVVIALKNAADVAGDAAAIELEDIVDWVRTKLVGFTPPEDQSAVPVTHIEGELVEFVNGVVWYEEVYAAQTYLEEVS